MFTFISAQTNIIPKKNTNFKLVKRIKDTYRIPKNSTEKPSKANYITLHWFHVLDSQFQTERPIYSRSQVGFNCGVIILKKKNKKERKAESGHRPAPVYVQYTLQPNARLLHPMVKVAPSPVARDATLSAQLTPLCACVRVVPA